MLVFCYGWSMWPIGEVYQQQHLDTESVLCTSYFLFIQRVKYHIKLDNKFKQYQIFELQHNCTESHMITMLNLISKKDNYFTTGNEPYLNLRFWKV